MSREYPGYFITFEGTEGCGKTTQLTLLVDWLKESGINFCISREPGGTEIGDLIRAIAHDKKHKDKMENWTEVFLYQASRAQHIREKVLKSLQRGEVFVSDRYGDSSVAYQGFGREIGMDTIKLLNQLSTGGLIPDLTIYFDISLETARTRKDLGGHLNRMDLQNQIFYQNVIHGYEEIIRIDQENGIDRWELVDGNGSIEDVFIKVKSVVESRLVSNGFIERPRGRERLYSQYD